ncbi:hypothetical protein JJB09_04915 [Rhizobium sp. KVB221]|uniref:Peptidase M10 serralysin C-terminal domain-containing protein n=1 Tax=Rhizobium setariae TaxID=2801340 RepID=A0A937CL90_9HYPH|nr:hypothetical protein [Rhizobium setariae]
MAIRGTDKSETIYGTRGEDEIYGLQGDDLIDVNGMGSSDAWASDSVHAGAGDDIIKGFTFDLAKVDDMPEAKIEVDGGRGKDTIVINFLNNSAGAGSLNLTIFQKQLDPRFIEWMSYDLTNAWKVATPPPLKGTVFNEIYNFKSGENLNVVYAGAGKDILLLDSAGGTFRGGGGNDILVVEDGENRLHGGAGADAFVFSVGGGKDRGEEGSLTRIADFQRGTDKIVVDLGAREDFGDRPQDLTPRNIGESSRDLYQRHIDYDRASGRLYVDDELVAKVKGGLDLHAGDFLFC